MFITGNLIGQAFSLISLIFIVGLGLLVLNNKRNLVNKIFFLLTLILNVWMIGSFMMFGSQTDQQVIFWDRFIYAAIVFWPALQYHFGLAVTFFNNLRRWVLRLAYFLSVIFLFLSQTDYFVSGVFRYAWGAHTIAQIFHHLFLIFFAIYSTLFFYNLIKKYQAEKLSLEKKRTLYFFLGFAVLNLIGITAFLPAYKISFFPLSLATPLMFALIISYAIAYFGLMEIKLIMRRYFVYSLSAFTVLVPVYAILFLINKFIPNYLFITSLPLFIFVFTLFARIKSYFYKLSNKYFFSSLYDINELIFNLNNRLRSSLDIKQIFTSTTDILNQAFHSQAMAVIFYEPEKKSWKLLFNKGFNFKEDKVELDYLAVKNLFNYNQPLDIDEVKKIWQKNKSKLLNYLLQLEIELLVPVSIKRKKISSLVIFGPKTSGESYSHKDKQVLESIASQIGISLENALLYQEVTQFNIQLKKEIARATKKLQEQNKILKQLDRAKTEFIGIASHQLRTPLTGIRWFSELLLKNKENNLNAKQLDFLHQINQSNQRLINLVNDLLDVSHIETGRKFDIICSKFKFNEVLREVLQENVSLLNTKRLRIHNKVKDNLSIVADRDKLKQVLQNLISNATKYSAEKTSINISQVAGSGDKLVFCIKDQGIGIPKKQQGQIFSKFFRASNADVQHSDGTGLGLYIAREIMRAHNGELWFESVEGKGTSFYLSLTNKNIKLFAKK